jgi:hypothetical protein
MALGPFAILDADRCGKSLFTHSSGRASHATQLKRCTQPKMSIFLAYGIIVIAPLLILLGLAVLVRGKARKNRSTLLICCMGVVVGIALFSYDRFGSFWAVDNCLDSGGRYNYESNVCEFK